MITNSWKSKTHWAEEVGGGAALAWDGGEGTGLEAFEVGRKRGRDALKVNMTGREN